MKGNFLFHGKQAVIFNEGVIPRNASELLNSGLFREGLKRYLSYLDENDSWLLSAIPESVKKEERFKTVLKLLNELAFKDHSIIIKDFPQFEYFFKNKYVMDQFVENLYNFWRHFERFFVFYPGNSSYSVSGERPYRTINETVESLDHVVRSVYRDIRENITGDHPRVYRQVAAGCQMGLITSNARVLLPETYRSTEKIPVIRQVYMSPPMILDPTMNKRIGFFKKVDSNPLEGCNFDKGVWLCYPAKVFDSLVLVYFNAEFIGLGSSLANLFDIAADDDLKKKPDAMCAFGVPPKLLEKYGESPTVFYEDKDSKIMIGACPSGDKFGYFGYMKKMILTLHNSSNIRKGRLPVHGAMVRICMKNGKKANIIIWGDSGTGKSETLEAFRVLIRKYIRDMTVIFDDMGCLELGEDGKIRAYGTETGAFVRLDDLQPGFAFGNMDRAIIHSPQKINARAVIPITTQEEVEKGHEVDFLLYANNYENVEEDTPVLEKLENMEEAMSIFRKGARMAKGTTGEKGLTHSFFANPFGPLQYEKEYEELAQEYFKKIYERGIFVGQVRTRLGIPGFERKGPEEAAKKLFEVISEL